MAETQDFGDKMSLDENIYINEADGLTNEHPMLPLDSDGEEVIGDSDGSNSLVKQYSNDSDSFEDLPTSLIVTNVHADVFGDEEQKAELENLFKFFSPNVKIQWFRSFRRLRVNFDSAVAAATARIQLHQYQCGKSVISCYFAQQVTPVGKQYLQPPAPFKQFLISPPASPPAGWEPRAEGEPLVNHDLLAALANLTPGETHELHQQSTDHPGIILHTANLADGTEPELEEVEEEDDSFALQYRGPIAHTRCPERT